MMDYENLPEMEDFVIVYKDNDQKNFGFIFKEHSSAKEVFYSDCIWSNQQDAEDYAYLSAFGRMNNDRSLDKIYKKASIH
tara:strand:- start:16432 stop:16671 length:240 start_codon:yes stop_codon:yes gene_type:complete